MARSGDEVDPALFAELAPKLDALVPTLGRTPWLPIVSPDDGGDLGSRYGARPWIGFGFAWPTCPACKEPLAFFVQLDLATLPADFDWPHRAGLVQLFYCTGGRVDACGIDPRTWVARHVPADRVTGPGVARAPRRDERRKFDWEPVRVLGWERGAAELPGYEETAWDAIDWYDEHSYDVHTIAAARSLAPRIADKLGGWPSWVQSPDYPPCPRCQAPMDFLLQVECNGHTGYQFGDLGCGYLLGCRAHADGVGFVWSCH